MVTVFEAKIGQQAWVSDVRLRSAPALELLSRAASSVGVARYIPRRRADTKKNMGIFFFLMKLSTLLPASLAGVSNKVSLFVNLYSIDSFYECEIVHYFDISIFKFQKRFWKTVKI